MQNTKGIIIYSILFLLAVIIALYSTNSEEEQSLEQAMIAFQGDEDDESEKGSLLAIRNVRQLYEYITGPFIDDIVIGTERGDGAAFIGKIRFRQKRIRADQCRVPTDLLFLTKRCYPRFSSSREFKESYGNSKQQPFQFTEVPNDIAELGHFGRYTQGGYQFHIDPEAMESHHTMIALALLFVWAKIFSFLTIEPTLGYMIETIRRCRNDLIGYGLIFLNVFAAFSFLGVFLFGDRIKDYSTVDTTMFTLFRILIGDFDFFKLQNERSIIGPLYFISFSLFVFFILLNIFLAIVNETFHNLSVGLEAEEKRERMEENMKNKVQEEDAETENPSASFTSRVNLREAIMMKLNYEDYLKMKYIVENLSNRVSLMVEEISSQS
ncbi:hypothetical protein ACOME3_004240 [Neoechinorhynchus agilis]